jgi:outer membrane protein OmpA-like peptidoglycan-associated protein
MAPVQQQKNPVSTSNATESHKDAGLNDAAAPATGDKKSIAMTINAAAATKVGTTAGTGTKVDRDLKTAARFGLDQSVLTEQERKQVQEVGAKIKEMMDQNGGKLPDKAISLVGYTDDYYQGRHTGQNKAGIAYNQALSERRAQEVKKELQKITGLPDSAFDVKGGGISYQHSNSTKEGRQQNRRVDVTVDVPEVPKAIPVAEPVKKPDQAVTPPQQGGELQGKPTLKEDKAPKGQGTPPTRQQQEEAEKENIKKEAKPEAKQAEAKPAQAKPAEAKPAEAKPAEAKPAEAKPAEAKPAEAKPAEAKPAQAKPTEAKPAEAKPAEAKPAEAKPGEAKPAQAKPTEAKPAEAKPGEAKPAQAKPTEAKPAEAKPAEAKPSAPEPAKEQKVQLSYQEIKDKAERLNNELGKWFNRDTKEIHKVLSQLDAEGQKAVADYYKDEYSIDLDKHLAKKLSGSDLEVAKKLREGAVEGTKEAVQLRLAIEGVGANKDGVGAALDGKSPEQIKQIAGEYQRLYGESLETALRGEWTLGDEQVTNVLSKLDTTEADKSTTVILTELNKIDADEAAILTEIAKFDAKGQAELTKSFKAKTGKDFDEEVKKVLNQQELAMANRLREGTSPEKAACVELYKATGVFTINKESIQAVLKDKTPEQASALATEYYKMLGKPLDALLKGTFSGEQLAEVLKPLQGKTLELRELVESVPSLKSFLEKYDPKNEQLKKEYVNWYGITPEDDFDKRLAATPGY